MGRKQRQPVDTDEADSQSCFSIIFATVTVGCKALSGYGPVASCAGPNDGSVFFSRKLSRADRSHAEEATHSRLLPRGSAEIQIVSPRAPLLQCGPQYGEFCEAPEARFSSIGIALDSDNCSSIRLAVLVQPASGILPVHFAVAPSAPIRPFAQTE